MLGSHLIKSWSSTQAIIALSSGEAEFYALVKCGPVALGNRNMLSDLGVKTKIRISTDASAAKGITARRGAGKARHIEVSQLWIQDKVRSGEISMRKVSTAENIADALTKYATGQQLHYHLASTGQIIMPGRHELAPETSEINYVGLQSDEHNPLNNYPLERVSDENNYPCQFATIMHLLPLVSVQMYLA